MSVIGDAIIYFRKMREMKQEELAAAVKISRPILSHIETGKVDPSFDLSRKIAIALGVTLPELGVKAPEAFPKQKSEV